MNPVRASLRFPQVTLALAIMLVAAGAYALLRMPRREDPKIHVRTGIVAAYYPGASVAEVESQVTQKVELRLFRVEGVRRAKTYSTSMNGAMFVNVEVEDQGHGKVLVQAASRYGGAEGHGASRGRGRTNRRL